MSQGTSERTTTTALDTAHAQLVEAVRSLVNGEDWRHMLDVAKRFHAYSPTNCILILSQRPEATRVAGYRAWQQLGRHVRRGERGIRILAPIVKRVDSETTDDTESRRVVGFSVATVFDVAQTDGEALPEVAPRLLAGEAPCQLWDALAKQVAGQGFALERGDCGTANGWTDHLARVVRVRDDVATAQACKTLAHELAHVLLHDAERMCRGVAEVEAESVAYLVCQASGLTSDLYSFPYVAGWANGDVETIQKTAQRSVQTARSILAELGEES